MQRIHKQPELPAPLEQPELLAQHMLTFFAEGEGELLAARYATSHE